MKDNAEDLTDIGPWLWNPDVAALLSWLGFTSAFGAAIHAANWKRLGQRRRMWTSLAWMATLPATICMVIFALAMTGQSKHMSQSVLPVVYLNVIAWYFLSGRAQSKHVAFELKGKYRRDSWFFPVIVAFLIFVLPKAVTWLWLEFSA